MSARRDRGAVRQMRELREVRQPRRRPSRVAPSPATIALAALALLAGVALPVLVARGPVAPEVDDAAPSSYASTSLAQAADSWAVGATFDVRYEVPTIRRPQRPVGATAGEPLVLRARHRIVARGTVDGREQLTMAVTIAEAAVAGGGRSYTVTMDAATRGLVTLAEALPDGRVVSHANPYAVGGPEAMLFAARRFPLIVPDLPRLPPSPLEGDRVMRTVERLDGLLPPFDQSVAPAADGRFEVELSRTDPDTGLVHRTTQRWAPDEPWWREARTTLGDEVLVTGLRLLPGAGARLWLPWAETGDG